MSETTTASPGTEAAAPVTEAADTTTTPTTTATAGDTTAAPASATTETKAADAGTLVGGDTTEKVVTAPADWPADWRQKLAGEDKKTLERLTRMGSPADLFKSYSALEQKLSSGEYKKVGQPPAADAKPEEVAAWRKENGIPEQPDGYKIELPNGVIPGEADKPVLDAFTKHAHEKNWDNAKVNEALSWYYTEQERQLAARAEQDSAFKQKSEDVLRSEWGQDFRPNLNAVKNLLAGMPEGAAENLLAGRFADGSKIGDNPGFIQWLASVSRELNPAATLVPAGTGDVGKNVNDRINDIVKLMGDRSSDYWRGPKAEAMQQEYRDLVEARERMKSRAA